MKKSQEFELRKKCNNLDALCGIKDYLYNDGPSRGLRALDLKNGKNIELTLLADRGLKVTKVDASVQKAMGVSGACAIAGV